MVVERKKGPIIIYHLAYCLIFPDWYRIEVIFRYNSNRSAHTHTHTPIHLLNVYNLAIEAMLSSCCSVGLLSISYFYNVASS